MNNHYLNHTKNFRNLRRLCVLLPLLLLLQLCATAQYSNLPVTGYTEDVVADGVGLPNLSTTNDVDGTGYVFVTSTFNPAGTICATGTLALPTNNTINSLTTVGLTYLLQPYTAVNSLRLTNGSLGTLTLVNPVAAGNIYLLATGGSGACSITATINFTDLTTQVISGSAADWCSGTTPATGQYYRVSRTALTCTGAGCQYLYDVNLAIGAANYSKKIASISIANSGGILHVMGVGMRAACGTLAAQPTALTMTANTNSSISGRFNGAYPFLTAGYLVVRYPSGTATITPPVSGTAYTAGQALGLGTVVQAATDTTFTATGLFGGSAYTFYVYAYNGPCAPSTTTVNYLTTAPLTTTLSTTTCAGTMSGTIPVGPSLPNTPAGGYTSLTLALADIATNGLSGNLTLELLAGYDGTSPNETFPITLPTNVCINSSKKLTIRPATGAVGLTITSASATATLDLNGATYITIDGRPGGAGSTIAVPNVDYLSIINTNAAGVALRMQNDARFNTIRYCDLQSANTAAGTAGTSSGVVFIGGSTGFIGNDNNTIDNCNIHATSGGFPSLGVYSYGSTLSLANYNDNDTISNCNIYDFYAASVNQTTAIKCENGTNAWVITGNKIFQTAPRVFNTTAALQHRALWITPSGGGAGNGFIITNNFIGGNNPAGTGTYTITSTQTNNYWAMDISVVGSNPTSIQGNTITNLSVTSLTTTANNFFRGISTGSAGNVNIGTITPNIIGAATGIAAIKLNSASGSTSYGILSSSAATINIANNIVGGITLFSSGAAANAMNFLGIAITSGTTTTITNNLVGSLTTPNSINDSNLATATTQSITGISVASGTSTIVSGNTVANLNNSYSSTGAGLTRGIVVTTSTSTTISNNTVRALTSTSQTTGTGINSCIVGIGMSTANQATVTGNTIHTLVASPAVLTAAVQVEGLFYSGNGSVPTNLITKNIIHSLDVNVVDNAALIIGLEILGGSNIVANNMIRLGIQPNGLDNTTAMVMRGIFLNTTTATNIYHNSVFIGGINVGSTIKTTAAFYKNSTGLHDVRNNIFVNNRSNATTGGGKHYQMFLNAGTTLTSGYNVYFGSGIDGIFGTLNAGTSDIASPTTVGWVSDFGSIVSDPKFIAPVADTATVNLHIQASPNPTPIESSGILLASITDDVDGQTRSTNSPVDIGADAGLFNPINMIVENTFVDQVTAKVVTNSTNKVILGIRVITKNNFNPLQLTSFVLNTAGSTTAANLTNAKVFFTGASSTFATGTQYGSTFASPSGAFTVTGSATLASGVNYFWVTYDISATAVAGNVVDARVDNIVLSGSTSPMIANGDPSGSRLIAIPLAGNFDIGALSTSYTTLNAAFTDLNLLGVSAPVTFTLIDPTYTLTDSVAVGAFAGGSPTKTVTLLPAASNTGAVITSSNASSTFEIYGAQYLVIDGRPGGVGSAISVPNTTNLSIINTSTAGVVLNINNDSRNNTIKYCDLQGANNVNATLLGTPAGVVFIGSTNGTAGNDNNTFDRCNIHSNIATNVLTMGVYSYGPAASPSLVATFNDSNTVSNCNIYDTYGGVALSTGGIVLDKGTNAWTLTGNSFFQTVSRTPVLTASVNNRCMYVTPANTSGVGNGFTIANNYFGGTAPLCLGTPLTSTTTAALTNLYEAINIAVAGGNTSTIKSNTITNLNIGQGASTGDLMHAIWVSNNGNLNIGGPLPSDGNIIGSSTTTGAITLASAGTTATPCHMIILSGSGGANSSTNILIQNNKIGGINLTNVGNSFTGVFCSSNATVTIDNNLIGSTTVPNSINASNTAATTAQFVRGINIPSGTAVLTITNNIIANLNNNGTSTTTGTNGTNASLPQTHGIFIISTSTVGATITGNTIKALTNASPTTSVGTASVLAGIAMYNSSAITSTTISSNSIDSLICTSAGTTAGIVPVGIFYFGSTAINNTIARNYVNNIDVTAVNTNAIIKGIEINAGLATVANNIVRLGIKADGTDLSTALAISGMVKSGISNNKFYHNTVYIGGLNVGSTVKNTIAFQRSATGLDDIRNNIFVNNRSNVTTGGKHYQVFLNAATSATLNNNVYFGNGSGSIFGSANGGTSDTTLYKPEWLGLGIDLNSINGDPKFIAATGTTATSNLHIHPTNPTPVESSGVLLTAVTDDYDGQLRSGNTPVDIGADGGNFVQADLVGPSIGTFTATNTSSTGDRTITVNITDATGVATLSGAGPKVYYYKSSGGVAGSYANTLATRTSGSAQNGQWSFTITAANMGGLSLNDSVYFYLTAQDSAAGNYLSSAPAGAGNFGATPPANLFSYKIVQGYTGVINVGVGQTFTSLTATGGIFDSINKGSLSGNVTLSVTSDLLLEDGTVALNQWAETGAGNYTVSIVPSAATERAIVGNVTAAGSGLIRLNGADRVKIDGRFAGSGRYLRFRNQALAGTTFQFINDAHRDTLTYCNIEGINNTSGLILFGTTSLINGSGNDSNGVNNCMIGDTLGSIATSTRPTTGISSTGTANFENSENSINDNNIYNFTSSGVSVNGTGNGNNWIISGNSFYNNMTNAPNGAQTCINFVPGVFSVNNKITGNYIGGGSPLCAGTTFVNTGNTTWKAISANTGTADSTYILNNTIQNINLSGPSTGSYTGIEVLGGLTSVRLNTVGHATTPNSIQTALFGTIINIWLNGASVVANVSNNTIANVTSTGNSTVVGCNGIRITNANTNYPLIVANNIIKTLAATNPTVSSITPSMAGIVSVYAGIQQVITGNTIADLYNNGNGGTSVMGINISNSAAAGSITRNLIYGLNNMSFTASAQVVGIHLDLAFALTVANNMIALGYNIDSLAIVSGIMDKSAAINNQFYFNTVKISGAPLSPSATLSHAFRRTTQAAGILRNNIFNNSRTAGTANYAIANVYTIPATGWVANYNIFSSANVNQMGIWNATESNLAGWKTNSLYDSNSVTYSVNFISTTDLHVTTGSIGNQIMAGKPIVGFTTDYDGQTRSVTFPYIGADENTAPVPVKLIEFNAAVAGNDVQLTWTTASESNNKGFDVERSVDGKVFETAGFVKGAGNSNKTVSYNLTDAEAFAKTNSTVLYYRLKQTDNDGAIAVSKTVTVSQQQETSDNQLSLFPNPVANNCTILFTSASAAPVNILVSDVQGRIVSTQTVTAIKGNNSANLEHMNRLQTGVYFVKVTINGNTQVLKLIKQ